MKWALIFLPLYFVTPALAQEFNAGFINGLWFSEESIFADKPTRIYVAIRNNTGADLSGRVEFYVNEKLITRTNVSALDGRIIESWADWTPTYGEHTITASLSRTELSQVGSSTKSVEVRSSLAEETLFVDYDTDGDGIGNREDIDDDGDGISDEVEMRNGTDPLVYNAPAEIKKEDDEETEDAGGSEAAARNEPVTTSGFEMYLTPSPARTALSSVSELADTTKQKLDVYREKRIQTSATADNPPFVTVNADGFGEISRSTGGDNSVSSTEQAQPSTIALGVTFIRTILDAIYTKLLSGLSLYLGHAMIVQLTLLLAILFGVYKLARTFGARKR